MNDTFDRNMAIIAGAEPQKAQGKQLSDEDKKKISEEYFKLFFNLTYTNWLRGGSLGTAWYKALSQMEQFVASKKSANPASVYLQQVFAAHKAKWSQIIMTNKHRDDLIQVTPEQKQKWNQRTAQNVTAALNVLNETIKAYVQPESENKKAQAAQQTDLKSATQKMQMLIMLKMKQQQKGMVA